LLSDSELSAGSIAHPRSGFFRTNLTNTKITFSARSRLKLASLQNYVMGPKM
jgi:hypothetical protein